MLAVASEHLVAIGSIVTPVLSALVIVVCLLNWLKWQPPARDLLDLARREGREIAVEITFRKVTINVKSRSGEGDSEERRLDRDSEGRS
ncbi:MAG: hypothetical protein LC808_21160 [Actinobacteria bacterium]|nr:hypothetical protein [Actinomycetota bacterium]